MNYLAFIIYKIKLIQVTLVVSKKGVLVRIIIVSYSDSEFAIFCHKFEGFLFLFSFAICRVFLFFVFVSFILVLGDTSCLLKRSYERQQSCQKTAYFDEKKRIPYQKWQIH